MLHPPAVNFADFRLGTVSQCFSCFTAFLPFESSFKDTKFFPIVEFFSFHFEKKVYLCTF